MKKFFTFFAAALMSVSMFGATVQEDIALEQDAWQWGYASTTVVNDGILHCTLTGEWGATSTGWGDNRDLTGWDKIIIVVDNMNGCDGEYWKLKAYLRDSTESEANQLEGYLGLDAEDRQQNYLVIDLDPTKACDLTVARILAIQCQPNGSEFKISRVYLEKEVEEEEVWEYFLIGDINGWNAENLTEDLKLAANPAAEGEYMITYPFAAGDQFKVVGRPEGKQGITWFPEGMDNNYQITEAGNYNVYFRPEGGVDGWHYGYIYAERSTEGIENVVITEKVQKVVVDGQLYIVRDGKFFNATGAQVK
jgi:hypothetical protein